MIQHEWKPISSQKCSPISSHLMIDTNLKCSSISSVKKISPISSAPLAAWPQPPAARTKPSPNFGSCRQCLILYGLGPNLVLKGQLWSSLGQLRQNISMFFTISRVSTKGAILPGVFDVTQESPITSMTERLGMRTRASLA